MVATMIHQRGRGKPLNFAHFRKLKFWVPKPEGRKLLGSAVPPVGVLSFGHREQIPYLLWSS
jgi:hypothetical protein